MADQDKEKKGKKPEKAEGEPKAAKTPKAAKAEGANVIVTGRSRERLQSAQAELGNGARTVALDHFRSERRRTRREQVYAGGLREVEEPRFAEGLSPALERAVAGLSAGEREVIALRVVLDLDGGTAARVLGISPTACSTRLSRALQKLEKELEAHVAA